MKRWNYSRRSTASNRRILDCIILNLIICGLVLASPILPSVQAVSAAPNQGAADEKAAGANAFPSAEGFGAAAVGGRGGRVIEVTNLNDSGPGSLRAAIEASGPRIVVFRVGGTITVDSPLDINDPYITIAGQTAPGGGITLRNDPSNPKSSLRVQTHDVIIRYLRARPGPSTDTSSSLRGITISKRGNPPYNVILDHVSLSWGTDETLSVWYDTHNITVQWSIVSEGLDCSTHEEGCHSKGPTLGSEGGGKYSIHHNLFAHNDERNPRIKTDNVVDVVNNVIYNPGDSGGWGASHVSDGSPVNYVGNYFKPGPSSTPTDYFISSSGDSGLYLQDNVNSTGGDDIRSSDSGSLISSRHSAPPLTVQSAAEAYQSILDHAGASAGLNCDGTFYLRRDAVDTRIINDVKNGTGSVIDDPSEVGGWPTLESGTACADGDNDGMPDEFENKYGFDASDASDGADDLDNDGYTNIEEYLNGSSPTEPTSATAPITPPVDPTPPTDPTPPPADPTPTPSPITVQAGLDRAALVDQPIQIDGALLQDQNPYKSDDFDFQWSKTAGPGKVSFGDDDELQTTASFSEVGKYMLRLTASDGSESYTDEVFIHVTPMAFYVPFLIRE